MKKLAGKSKKRIFIRGKSNEVLDPDIIVKVFELIQGDRETLRFYSKRLESEICLINPELTSPLHLTTDCPIYTTDELAFILPLSDDEFRRFHYLKTRLVD